MLADSGLKPGRLGYLRIVSEPRLPDASSGDDVTPNQISEVTVETVEVTTHQPGPVEEVDPTILSERERVTVEDDGSVSRRLDRVEQRPTKGPPSWLVPALLIALLLVLAAIAAGWYFTQSDTSSVPAVEGLAVDDAVSSVEEDGFDAVVVNEANDAAAGIVFRQSPPAGTDLEDGSNVQLFASTGPAEVTVPNTVGVMETEARDRLAAVGLTANVVSVFSEQALGEVTAQAPAAGTQAASGTAVRLNVSKGSAMTTVPSLVGLTQTEAESQLEAAGLEGNFVPVPSTELSGTVVAQNPVSGQVSKGSTVRLNISTGP